MLLFLAVRLTGMKVQRYHMLFFIQEAGMKKTITAAIVFICIFSLFLFSGEEEGKILVLKIGPPELKDMTTEVFPGKIYSLKSGNEITFDQMIEEMAPTRIVYVGESHNSLPMHMIQAKIIQALVEQGHDVAVGMEMFTPDSQEPLNKWSLGILSQKEFIQQAEWYINWNFNFGFYAEIFDAAKFYGLPIYGLNAPRKIISKIRMQGWKALSQEEKSLVPEPDLAHQEHRQLIRTIFESMEMPHQMKGEGLDVVFEGLYRAQSAWDEVMAFNLLESLKKGKEKIVALAGSGHLLYNLGINRRTFAKSQLPFQTVVCVEVPEDKGSVDVSRSFSDYVVGLKEEDRPAFPSIGLKFKKFSDLDNPVIERDPLDGVALDSGFEKGDVVLAVDGEKYTDINVLRTYLARFSWGDEVKFSLLRSAQEKEIVLLFEQPEEGKKDEKDKDKKEKNGGIDAD